MNEEYGLQWLEWQRNGRSIAKQKFFKSEKARAKFIEKLEQKDNFDSILAYSDPRTDE